MPKFKHDPSRVHPLVEDGVVMAREVTDTYIAEPAVPRTQQLYNWEEQSFGSIIFGESGVPHRIMYITTLRRFRNQGSARALVTQIVSDFDHDGLDSTVVIRNYEPDCDVPRLQAFFESFGYVPTVIYPDEPDIPQLFRAAQPVEQPLTADDQQP